MSAATETSKRARMTMNIGASAPPNMLATDRVGLISVVIAAAIAVIAGVIYLSAALEWRGLPFVGVLTSRTLMVDASTPINAQEWAARNAGLRRGDHLIAINGEAFADTPGDYAAAQAGFQAAVAGLAPGTPTTLTFERPVSAAGLETSDGMTCADPVNGLAVCSVSITPTRFSDNDFIGFFVIPFVSGLIILISGIVVVAVRPNQQTTRLVALTLITVAVFVMGLFDLNSTHRLELVWMLATVMGGGSFIALALIFPTRMMISNERPNIRFVPPVAAGLLGLVLYLLYLNPPDYQFPNTILLGVTTIGLLGMVIFVLRLLRARQRATSLIVRDQANTVLIGVTLALALAAVWQLNNVLRALTAQEFAPLNTSAAMPFMILPALSLAYAVLQYRTFDTDRVISQGITYTVMLTGLIVGYFLLVFSASLITRDLVSADSPILIAIVIFIMAVLFVPVRTRLQAQIDRLYFRTRFNYQERVESFSSMLGTLGSLDTILREFQSQVQETLSPRQMFIFLPGRQTSDYVAYGVNKPDTDVRFSPDSPLITALRETEGVIYLEAGQPWSADVIAERARLLILRALVIVGFKGASQLNGFVVLAPPLSKNGRYTYEELRFLQNLTGQVSVAVERAQVVDSLERRVRELGVLSQVSQAVNFTVEFDDLLELISTQADKLVDATHFYIAMRDPATNELYYAFFLENEERVTEKESRRWTLGRDLISEIVRTGQPLRVNNFAQAVAERGETITQEDPNLRAWMGVPMLVGSRVLGVLAAGTSQIGHSYSDEQLKIFIDIGSLAATSIDKARLFEETNARARQLTALNDISQKIVASEFDLEGLLQLITGSATEILDCEAGSLLLTTDDGSGDLEFRVAIGGSGASIIGARVPAGKGLVGEVARTGEPVVVNDVPNDPRWAGELGKGPFKTSTVLAVPLITQDRVIGVLEVLNKRQGGFSPEEANLLATFAGQAAVAIENARLFQLTDQQLSMRLSELETMERIDVELNRSLDLVKVARITVQWALENSSATAAALGVIVGEAPMQRLEIVYQEGYDGDAPDGAEGRSWPLDRGIASRVLRTKQADLTPDVTMDTDYVPSLKGAKSQITIPMLSGGAVNAMLIMETNREPRLRLADLPFLQRLCEHASIAISNAQLYTELNRANQSKSEFVSFVAHELKNPLTSIRGYSDFLLGNVVGQLNEQQRNFLATIRTNAERMNTLVSDLNDVTKLQTNNMRIDPSPMDFRRVVTETLRPLEKQIADKEQTLDLDLPEEMPLIQGDENRLIQVLTNLVSNAHKYTPHKGTITIGASPETDMLDKKGRQLPPLLHVRVTDTGIGMSEDDVDKLFTPYFRSQNPLAQEQLGTGLGLTITRGIIEQHHGDIWVESALGVGTTFHFTIPLALQSEGQQG